MWIYPISKDLFARKADARTRANCVLVLLILKTEAYEVPAKFARKGQLTSNAGVKVFLSGLGNPGYE